MKLDKQQQQRITGNYPTPPIWVKESQDMITEVLGTEWRDEYVVWDCACGTANLTRDNNFKELYLSTLEDGDIQTIKDMGFNRGATIFKYDFLSEIGIDGVPEGFKKAMAEGKKILIYINPPYGTSGMWTSEKDDKKTDIAKTVVNADMLKDKMGFAARNLYCQFIHKIAKLAINYPNQIVLAIFAPPLYITSSSNEKLRQLLYSAMNFKNGMLFQASNFSDVAGQWGISFTIWR